ncbi:MAG: Rpn family recombination-promoting nuclease/putative transposase [Lachnospiraceae bacterium]|nr:Rpn family recombination-promoting nuclease/putative transposase [Lachnospiraceae bacterium]
MSSKKTLQELTIKDNFMFGAVMGDADICRRLLEMILQFPIESVEVSQEKSIVYHPEYKGIRLDVYAKDANRTHYNVEMQAIREKTPGKRTRYYHSQIDMEILLSGAMYADLPNTYVIFICDFDPFGKGRYCYTFDQKCVEIPDLHLEDGSTTIFLSTCGKNESEVPEEMVKFLQFVKADLEESTKDFQDDFVAALQKSIQSIKASREQEVHFMGWYEMLRDERAEGKAEGKAEVVLEFLMELGPVPEDVREKIITETDLDVLTNWTKLAAKSDTMMHFLENM